MTAMSPPSKGRAVPKVSRPRSAKSPGSHLPRDAAIGRDTTHTQPGFSERLPEFPFMTDNSPAVFLGTFHKLAVCIRSYLTYSCHYKTSVRRPPGERRRLRCPKIARGGLGVAVCASCSPPRLRKKGEKHEHWPCALGTNSDYLLFVNLNFVRTR